MKAKEKEIQKKIVELCDAFGDNDHFIVFRESGNNVNIALSNDHKTGDAYTSFSLARVINEYLCGDANGGTERLSEIIITAIEGVIYMNPKAGAKLIEKFTKLSMNGIKRTLDMLSEDNDIIDEKEDCDGCELIKTCNEEKAIKYRKAHGIPKPKKSDRGERKMKGGRKIKVS